MYLFLNDKNPNLILSSILTHSGRLPFVKDAKKFIREFRNRIYISFTRFRNARNKHMFHRGVTLSKKFLEHVNSLPVGQVVDADFDYVAWATMTKFFYDDCHEHKYYMP